MDVVPSELSSDVQYSQSSKKRTIDDLGRSGTPVMSGVIVEEIDEFQIPI